MTLGEYLRAPLPAWDWVNHDCSRWLDRWLVLNGHRSAMAATEIGYHDRLSALRIIQGGGGLLALWSRGMAAIGLQLTDTARAGDAAILVAPTEDRTNETCGIWTGERWAAPHHRGLVFGVGAPLRIWRV